MTTTEIATTHGSALTISAEQEFWNDKQVAALNQLGVQGASQADLAVFFHQVTRTGLDPFARQIYMLGRKQWNQDTRSFDIKQTIQTGIDGFRLIARRAVDRSGESLGYEDNMWCGEDGQWRDVWLSAEAPRAAKVTVIRNGERYPAIATLSEYAGTKKDGGLTKMWAEKPALMLAKCAEALALRKAFPQDLSGLYTSDEMPTIDQDGNPAPGPQQIRSQQSRPNGRQSSADVARAALGMTAPERDVDAEAQKLGAAIAQATTKDELRELWTAAGSLTPDYTASLRANCDAKAADLDALAAAEQAQAEETLQTVLDAEIIPEQSAA